jgi:hypothetical protein
MCIAGRMGEAGTFEATINSIKPAIAYYRILAQEIQT